MIARNKRASAVRRTPHRRGRPRSAQLSRPDFPFAMKLADGRTMVVEVPGRWTADDHDGSVLLLPEGVRFLDRVQTLATKRLHSVTPAYITTLREALGMTQTEFGNKIGVAKLSVSRWERGQLRPSKESLAEIEKLRHDAIKQGVVLA